MSPSLFPRLIDPGPLRHLSPTLRWPLGLAVLALRWWLAWPFLRAGLHRVSHWSAQDFLFTEVHPVPFLPAFIAAPLTTGAEIVLGLSLVLGLFGRVGAAGLGVMAAALLLVIGQTPQGLENGIALPAEQVPWMIAAVLLVALGSGPCSLDALLSALTHRRLPSPLIQGDRP